MSHQRVTVPYRCLNDCQQAGCPGHDLTLTLDRSTGTVELFSATQQPIPICMEHAFDQHAWEAAVAAWQELDGGGT